MATMTRRGAGSRARPRGAQGALPLPLAIILVAGILWIGAPPASAVSAAQVSAGNNHTCAVTTGGGAKCWGAGANGRLGNGGTADSWIPVDVTGLGTGVAQISAGDDHTCAVTVAGGAKCWGFGGQGRLGNGLTDSSSVPMDVTGLTSGVAQISAGGAHTCAVTTNGAAKCWGAGNNGRLGNGGVADTSVPVDVTGLTSGVAQISAGAAHTCVVTTGGGVKCWGLGGNGRLGNGGVAESTVPVDVTGLGSGVAQVSAGAFHTCAVTTAGSAKCWGAGEFGRLGNGDTGDQVTPVDVTGLGSGVAQISAGEFHSCAVTTAGGAKCWGSGTSGRLGNGGASSLVPVDVTGLTSGVAQISAGFAHTCAVTVAGGAKCWGFGNNGRLGNGDTSASSVPVDTLVLVPVTHALTVVRLGAGSGTVTSDVPGIDCGATCGADYLKFAQVTLTATPTGDSTFSGWTGSGCAGTGACTLTMNQIRSVVASFDLQPVATNLSIKAPNKASRGKKITVTGKLTSDLAACTNKRTVTLHRGKKKVASKKTDAVGAYKLSFKVKKTDPAKKAVVQVKFATSGPCKANASKKRTIKLV